MSWMRSFAHAGGEWHAVILDLEAGRRVFDLQGDEVVHVASVVKVPVAMLLFASLEKQGVPPAELGKYIEAHGDGNLLSNLLHAMLVDSDEKATGELLTAIRRSGLDIQGTLSDWGAPNLDLSNRTAPLEQIADTAGGALPGRLHFLPGTADHP